MYFWANFARKVDIDARKVDIDARKVDILTTPGTLRRACSGTVLGRFENGASGFSVRYRCTL